MSSCFPAARAANSARAVEGRRLLEAGDADEPFAPRRELVLDGLDEPPPVRV
jgi:hypothetical protein